MKEVPFRAGELIEYARKPDKEYVVLQNRLRDIQERKGIGRNITKELETRFLQHFGIRPQQYPFDFPAGGSGERDTGGITDHYRCYRGLGIFDVVVTHPYQWQQITPTQLQNAIAKYQLLCIVAAHQWDYYYPEHSGCFILIRFRNEQRKQRNRAAKIASRN